MAELGSINISGIPNIEIIYDMNFQVKPNEHAVARVKALFSEENINITDKSVVSISNLKTGKNLFCGYLSTIYDNNKDNRLEKTIELISCSIDFDLKAYKRSFQNSSETYESIYNKIADQVKGGGVACGSECSESIGKEIYQYEETNWQLIKRLAGDLGISIYPEISSGLPRIYIGTTNESISCINDYLEHSEGASDRYFNTGAYAQGKDISLYRYFRVKTYENLEIGSLVQFENVYNRVISKKAYSKKSEIIFEYILGQSDLGVQKSFINVKACGAVLKGTASNIGTETLKVSLDIDKEYGSSEYCDYPYQSITSNMLYCMPEKDTSVYLNLNDSEGSEARVISCSRTNGDECSDTTDPINKTFVVPSGITLKMNEKNIKLISSENAKNTWDLNVIDEEFIKFNTAATLKSISNNGHFNIKSNIFNINSPFEITCSNGAGGNIKVSGTIEVSGNNVAVRAEGRIKFSPINDAPTEIKITANKLWKLAAKLVLTALVVAVACVVAVALAPVTIAASAVVAGVVGLSVLGGGIYAGVTVYAQMKDDKEKGINRSWGDYVYMSLDKFCTGAMLTAPTVIGPLSLPLQLLGVAGVSTIYQKADGGLDSQFGGDFYDSDSSFGGSMLLDVGCALFGGILGKCLNSAFGAILKKSPYLGAMNRTAARQYIRETYGPELMHLWKEFLEQTAGKRQIYQVISGKIVNSILANTPADEIFNKTFPDSDYKEMGKDTYFSFNNTTKELELVH